MISLLENADILNRETPSRSSDDSRVSSGLWIAELFHSIQGEGRYSDTPSVFVRTTGCNLRCHFCDTPFTSWAPEGKLIEQDELLEQIAAYQTRHVVLTGGEPLLQPAIVPLSHQLRNAGYFVTIETAGTLDRPVAADLMSISPKRSNSDPAADSRWLESHRRARHHPAVIHRFIRDYDFQLKFVVDTPDDLADIDAYLREFPAVEPHHVWLMPQGVSPDTLADKRNWLEPAALARGYHFCPRLHIERFGHTRGT